MSPVNITIVTENSGISLKYLNLKDNHTEINKLAEFFAQHPNLIDVFSLVTNLAEHHLVSKLHQQNLIEY